MLALAALMLAPVWGWGQENITPVRTDVSGFPTWTDASIAGTTYLQLLTATSSTISPAMNFDSYNGETLNFKARTYGGADAAQATITVSISINNGSSWTLLGTRGPTTSSMVVQTAFDISAYNGTQVKIKFESLGAFSGKGFGIDDIAITGTVASSNDQTSKVVAPTTQTAAGDLSSTVISSGSAMDVFKFKISDLGTADGLATKVTTVKIKKFSGTADWTDHIAGASLWDGVTQITTGTVSVTDADITFPISSGNLDVANGGDKELTLKVWLNTTNIIDNSTMAFTVSQTSHGFISDAAGSGFAADFGAAVTGNTMTVRVVATKLVFVTQPSSTGVNVAMTPDPTVKACDANNNTDVDYSTAVSVTSSGTLTGSPVAGIWASGISTFSNLTHTVVGTGLKLTAASGTLTSVVSDAFNINIPSNEIYYHDFGTTSITTKPYTGVPVTFAANLSNSSWTTSAAAFGGLVGNGGTPSQSLSINNSSGTPTFILTFNVASGYEVAITSYDFWRVSSGSGATNWTMTINGTSVGSGTIPGTGTAIGQKNVTNAISGLTGTVTVVYTMSGASGTGTSRVDDFKLWGAVSALPAPTTQAFNINFTGISQTGMIANWTNGNGAKRVVVMNTTNSFTAPANGTDPTANTVWQNAGQQVVYNGTAATVPVTGLAAGTTYWFRAYEYNGAGSTTLYNTTTATNNPNSQATNAAVPILAITGTPTNHGEVCPTFSATAVQYTITNTGTVQADGVTVLSGGANAGDFAVSDLSSTAIAALGGTATYNVTFTPASPGDKSATITVTSSTSGSNSPTSSLTGKGTTSVAQAVTSSAATSVLNTKATLNGNVTTLGVCPATSEKGFVYSVTATDANPIVGGTGVTKASVAGLTTGAYTLPLTGLTTNTGYSFKAYVFDGTNYAYGSVFTFTTNLPATKLAYGTAPPSTGSVATNLAAFTVQAQRADNSIDGEFTGNITVAKVSGAGNVGGTLTVAAVAGTATFSLVQFDAIGTYTINATALGLTDSPTSGDIVVTLVNATGILWSSAAGNAWLTSANWTGNAVPTSTQVAQFGVNPTPGTSANINGGTTSSGAIELTSGRLIDLTIGNNSGVASNGSITLNGVAVNAVSNVIIRNNSAKLLTIQNTGSTGSGLNTMSLTLGNTTNNIINIDGAGGITISSIISGSGRNLTLAGAGTGVLTLTGANTYTGTTTVSSGTLDLQGSLTNSALTIKNGATLKINGNNVTLASLTIESGGIVVVEVNKSLTVSGAINNNAGNAGLVIKSTAGGTGSLIHNTAGIAATVERHLVKYNAVGDQMFHFISSPVAAQAIQTEFVSNPIADYTDFYSFSELANEWINTRTAANIWNTNFETNFIVGKGYLVAYPDNVIKNFIGDLNSYPTGSPLVLASTNTAGKGGGWNLLGNPFPSAIDWNLVTLGDGMDDALYYYDNTAYNYRYYIKLSGETGSLGSGQQQIPAMQGFMVHAKTTGTKTVTLTNAARTHSGQNVFYKSTTTIPGSLSLKVTANGYDDEAFIHFNQGATTAFDGSFDAYKLRSYSDKVPMIFTKGSDDSELAINGLPEVDASTVIPVYFEAATEGEHTLTANLEGLPNAIVNLVDIKLNRTQNLKENPVYSFTASNGDNANRFKLTFASVGINNPEATDGAQVYAHDGVLYVETSAKEAAIVNVYNLTGQLVMQGKTGGNTLSTFNASALGNGVYVVTVISKQGVVSQKVIIRK